MTNNDNKLELFSQSSQIKFEIGELKKKLEAINKERVVALIHSKIQELRDCGVSEQQLSDRELRLIFEDFAREYKDIFDFTN
jgi:dihydroorotase-like cyclic amidohydrolase